MKKLVVILLTLGMVLSMFACAAPATTPTEPAPAAEATEAPAAEAAAPADAAPMYIPVMAKGFQHQFWQAVKTGAEAAAKDLGVEIYFDGPASETEIDAQVNMVKKDIKVKQGVDKDTAKKVVKIIKDTGLKVQASIMDEQVRVTGKKIDDLQELISILEKSQVGIPMQYENFRS